MRKEETHDCTVSEGGGGAEEAEEGGGGGGAPRSMAAELLSIAKKGGEYMPSRTASAKNTKREAMERLTTRRMKKEGEKEQERSGCCSQQPCPERE